MGGGHGAGAQGWGDAATEGVEGGGPPAHGRVCVCKQGPSAVGSRALVRVYVDRVVRGRNGGARARGVVGVAVNERKKKARRRRAGATERSRSVPHPRARARALARKKTKKKKSTHSSSARPTPRFPPPLMVQPPIRPVPTSQAKMAGLGSLAHPSRCRDWENPAVTARNR